MKKELLIPEGMRDYLPAEAYTQRVIVDDLLYNFSLWGYNEVRTPVLETWNIIGKEKEEERDFLTLIDKTGDLLVLRPEMTAPIARLVGTHLKGGTDYPLRLCYEGEVFSQKSFKEGKKRQRKQVGIELIDEKDSFLRDCEVLLIALEAMTRDGVKNNALGIGHIDITEGLLRELISDEEKIISIKKLMVKKDIVALKSTLNSILKAEDSDKILTLARQNGGQGFIEKIKSFSSQNKYKKAIERFEKILGILRGMGYEDNVFFDFSLLGDFSYYTGLVFEGYGEGAGVPLLTGGRYDHLLETYYKPIGAVGFAIDADVYISTLIQKETSTSIQKVVITDNPLLDFKKAEQLRQKGSRVSIDLEGGK